MVNRSTAMKKNCFGNCIKGPISCRIDAQPLRWPSHSKHADIFWFSMGFELLKSEATISHQNSSGGNSPFLVMLVVRKKELLSRLDTIFSVFCWTSLLHWLTYGLEITQTFILAHLSVYTLTQGLGSVCVCSLSCLSCSLFVCVWMYFHLFKKNQQLSAQFICPYWLKVFIETKVFETFRCTRSKNGRTAICFCSGWEEVSGRPKVAPVLTAAVSRKSNSGGPDL